MYASLSGQWKQAKIESVSSVQHKRIAAESLEEGEAHLQQLRGVQKQRIAAESMEERGLFSTIKECSGTKDCCRVDGGEGSSSSASKECTDPTQVSTASNW